jgi:hypothetical protein
MQQLDGKSIKQRAKGHCHLIESYNSSTFREIGEMARVTGLEPATSGVTGRHSNQLSYTRAFP